MNRKELKSLYKYSCYISTDKDLLSDRQKGRRAFFKQNFKGFLQFLRKRINFFNVKGFFIKT